MTNDLLFEQLRSEAVAQPEPCGYCHALTGELCINSKSGGPLEHAPAHWARLKSIDHLKPKVRPDERD